MRSGFFHKGHAMHKRIQTVKLTDEELAVQAALDLHNREVEVEAMNAEQRSLVHKIKEALD